MKNPSLAPNASLTEEFRRFVAEHLGLNFPPERTPDLVRGIVSACPELGFKGTERCMQSLMGGALRREHAEILASHLTIGETYFFREGETFEALENEIVPEILKARRQTHKSLRIWSAGCATGEEPYSIAMLLEFKFPELREWHVSILATDINPVFLKKAASGMYSEWSFRQTPSWVKAFFFRKREQGRFELAEHIRSRVSFAYLNLAEDVYPAVLNNTNAIDILFCRNVLMYFTPNVAARVVRRFELSLAEGGWVTVSPCDVSQLRNCPTLVPSSSGLAFHRKQVRSFPVEDLGLPAVALGGEPPPGRGTDAARRKLSAPARNHRVPVAVEGSRVIQEAADLSANGQYGAAAGLLSEYLEAVPGDTGAIELMAKACANLGHLSEALDWCARGLERAKLNLNLHLLEGTILAEEGRTAEAMASLNRVLYLDPRHVLAHFALGNIYHQLGRIMDADRHFRQALNVLEAVPRDEVVAGSEGMTAGRLREIITSTLRAEQR